MKGMLAGAINRLGEREKIVITLYYEGLTLAEIGQVLGVTELRVCQMHTKAVPQLRAKMQDARYRASPGAAREPAGPPVGEAIHNFVSRGPLADPAG
jgi:Sigma-70, region 4